jgi:hypothetical protein
LVDDFHDQLPKLEKDIHWDYTIPQTPYYTQMSKDLKTRAQIGSAEQLQIPVIQQAVIEDPEAFKALPTALKRQSIISLQQQASRTSDCR